VVEVLPELDQLSRGFLDNLPIAFFIYRQGRFCMFNDCFQERLGYSSQELRAVNCWDIIYPDDRKSAQKTELKERSQVDTRIKVAGSPRRLSAEVELVLFRIAQEALRNVEKHSQATECVVKVAFSPKKVGLQVGDNGKGFQLPELLSDLATQGKLGLIGMQERATLLGGHLEVKSELGKGTTVRVEVVV